MKIHWDGIEWGEQSSLWWFNYLPKKDRHWGYDLMFYDHQGSECFGFWFFNIGWNCVTATKRVKKKLGL
jgi:hypothetical protein